MAKEKKWAAFKGKFQKYRDPKQDSTFFERVATVKKEIEQVDNAELGRVAGHLKKRKEVLEKEVKQLNIEIEAVQMILTERFENLGLQSLKLANGALLYLNDEPYSSVKDREALVKWLKENDMEEMLTPQWQSLNAMVKERLLADLPIPNGVEIFMKTTVNMRKGNDEVS